ncbi:MAG: oxidoreductase [Bacteroidota bacterium]|nr:oxidoreductase [Bacteroidota bacterium]MDP3146741.1 oxidoreductase [Bacteroidota bacterium]
MKTALVVGATGLVGSNLVNQLNDSKFYSKIILLVRRKSELNHLKIEEKIIDFDNIDASIIKGDDIFCAIGTTIKKAGSKENQYKIDCEYPFKIAQIAKRNNVKQFILVSSLGADAKSSNFYLKTKGDLEEKISDLNFETFIIIRPSLILGDRKEFRLGEKIGVVLFKLLSPLFIGGLKKYKGVKASSIAKTMIKLANENLTGKVIVESDKIS